MKTPPSLGFQHAFLPGQAAHTLLMLHGTGGTEHDLVPLGRALDPAASILSPRGQVLENGMPRFFRRLAEGVFDEEDLIRRTHDLAQFIAEAAEAYALNPQKIYAVGYSNGANIAGGLLLLRPEALAGAALLRAMVPLVPETPPRLTAKPILIAAGQHDPIVSPEETQELTTMLQVAGADVTVHAEKTGHNLTQHTIDATRIWLEKISKV